jgi:hypothetical protein
MDQSGGWSVSGRLSGSEILFSSIAEDPDDDFAPMRRSFAVHHHSGGRQPARVHDAVSSEAVA